MISKPKTGHACLKKCGLKVNLRLKLDLASEGEEVTRLTNHGCQLTLLSYDFSHNISVGLFYVKKCYNCIIFFIFIFLWDLFVMSLVLSGKNLIKIVEGHMRNTCRKVNSQAKCPTQYSLSRRLTRDFDS